MKRFTLISFTVLSLILSSYSSLNPDKDRIRKVIIDAGHGGHDSGCQFAGVQEKKVALVIALKLGRMIEHNLKDVKVLYTRTEDEFIPLGERAAIGNRNNADLFISIHCNANKKTTVSGTETFAMGLHVSQGNLDVAKRENSAILLEEDYQQNYEGFDPNSPEAHIYFSLFQNAYLDQSLLLASKIEDQFKKTTKRSSRGVKQAGFIVLWKASMPSILIETGFLSNSVERAYLKSETGQEAIAKSIFNAFKEYKSIIEEPAK